MTIVNNSGSNLCEHFPSFPWCGLPDVAIVILLIYPEGRFLLVFAWYQQTLLSV